MGREPDPDAMFRREGLPVPAKKPAPPAAQPPKPKGPAIG
jgi:hypothetical protein